MDPYGLGQCCFYMKTILKKCPFKGTGKLSNLFDIVLRGHEQASGVAEKISVGVSHPPGINFPRYLTPLNNFLADFANTCSAGSD